MNVRMIAICLLAMSILVSGCGPGQLFGPTPTPTSTPIPLGIAGQLVGLDGPIGGAKVSLHFYTDQACVDLFKKEQPSEEEKKQLDECAYELTSTTADQNGEYKFSDISDGWYRLDLEWTFSQKPPFPLEIRDGFLIVWLESNGTPKVYKAVASQMDIFEFSGEEQKIVNFDYNQLLR